MIVKITWLTAEQKKMLQNLCQEHIFLINEQKEFELVPYEQINDVANGRKEVRAFILERKNDVYVVYWHISANKSLELPLNKANVTLYQNMGQEESVKSDHEKFITIPVSNRRYIKAKEMPKEKLKDAFKNAKIINYIFFQY
jgi:hypothetical protein